MPECRAAVKFGSGSASEPLAGQRDDGRRSEAAGTDRDAGGIFQRARQRATARSPAQTGRVPDEEQERQPLDSVGEVDEPAKRRLICPVQVVDDEQRRMSQSEVRRQPVKAVKLRERRLGAVSRARAPRQRAKHSAPPRRRATRHGPLVLRPRAAPRTAAGRSRTRTRPPARLRAQPALRNRLPRPARAPRPEAASCRSRRCPRRQRAGRRPTAPHRASPPTRPIPRRARAAERGRVPA